MSITCKQLYSEIIFAVVDSPTDASTDPISGLYTRAEIVGRINYRLEEFNKRTGIYMKNAQLISATAGNKDVSTPADVIDIQEVSYNSPTIGYTTIPKGSVYEGDIFISNEQTAVDAPQIFTIEDSPVLSISLTPPPNANNSVRFAYTARPIVLTSPPDTTPVPLPDDFVPFIKWGVLADIFGKSGEVYDPQRESACRQLYEFGIEIAKIWVTGQS